MKTPYEIRAQKFIKDFFPFISECETYYQFSQAVAAYNYVRRRHVFMAYGLTRIAFITSDYVVKINFARHDENFERFGDCETEIAVYQKAEHDGYEYLFAKISPYYYQEHNFYIMPRINGIGRYDDDAEEHLSYDEYLWVYSHVHDLHCNNYGWKNGHIVIIDYACADL